MNCVFEKISESEYRCIRCGFLTKHFNPIVECRSEPTLLQKTVNFGKAFISHFLNGNPTCSEEEIQERYKICKNCPSNLFKQNGDAGTCLHESCGCTLKDFQSYLNKLAWADQKCPMGHWIESSGTLK